MDNNSTGITLLHTGDLHLGFSYRGMAERADERQQDNLETFLYIISICQRQNIDILLIAGDLFDTPKPNRALLETVRKSFSDIEDTLVIISPGNHDYYESNGIYDDIEAWSDNVYIFRGEMDYFEFNIRNDKVRIYGAAFTERYQVESLMKQRRMIKDIAIHIGVFHGDLGSCGSVSKYNRITATQIEDNRFDYTALGHLHSTEGICYAGASPYAYSGSPEGHGFDETGAKGIYIGRVNHQECELEFLRTCRRQYIVERICVEEYEDIEELADSIQSELQNKYGEEYKDFLYRITFWGNNKQDLDLNRVKFYLNSLYYIEIVDETVYETVQKLHNNSLEESYSSRLQRLIIMEEKKEDCDEVQIERYKRALQLGLATIECHSGR